MDDHRFDALTRSLAGPTGRRGLLAGLTGVLAGLAGLVGARSADAQPRTPCRALGQVCRPRPGLQCCPGTVCRAGRCACPRRQRRCRGRCIGASQCCGKRCPGGAVCRQGRCRCPAGKRRCQGRCIRRQACCRNRECGAAQVCRSGRCTCRRCAPGQACRSGTCCSPTTAAVQAALAAVGPATIQLCPDTVYQGSFTLSRDVTIVGAGATSTFLDGGEVAPVVTVESGVTAELRGLRIRNGSGGALGGGGVFNEGTLTLTGCRLIDNTTDVVGGGIANLGTLTLDGSEVVSNECGFVGGGIWTGQSTTLTLQNGSRVDDNTAGTDGGGIYNLLGTVILLDTSSVSGNTAPSGDGGGIFYFPLQLFPGALTLAGSSVVAGNTAMAGGGIFVDDTGPGTVTFADAACVRDNSEPQCVGTTCPVCPA